MGSNGTAAAAPDTAELPPLARPYPGAWLRRQRGWFLAIALLLVALGLAVMLASPVWKAPFRLQAQTDFVGLTAQTEAQLAFDIVDWELRNVVSEGAPATSAFTMRRQATGVPPKSEPLMVWLSAGDEVLLQRIPATNGSIRFSMSMPLRPVTLAIQLTEEPGLTTSPSGSGVRVGGSFRFQAGGAAQSVLEFGVARMPDESKLPFAISGIGFGRPTDDGNVHRGLISGTLHFLDKPDAELRLWRGTDLRFRDVDGELSSIVLSADGIEVNASGLTGEAALHVRTRTAGNRQRSVMPTFYDWLKGEPFVAVAVGLVTFLAGAAGIVLSAAQVSRRFSERLLRLGGE